MTVEATSSYEWFIQLIEPLADRVVLAHPKKLRVIAESTRKTDQLDAQVLAEFLVHEGLLTRFQRLAALSETIALNLADHIYCVSPAILDRVRLRGRAIAGKAELLNKSQLLFNLQPCLLVDSITPPCKLPSHLA